MIGEGMIWFLGILAISIGVYSIYAISTLLARLNDIHDELFEIRKAIVELKDKK